MAKYERSTPAMRNIGKFTNTVAAVFADPAGNDCFVPGWDKRAGGEQAMARARTRARMGKKKTPIGRGVLTPRA